MEEFVQKLQQVFDYPYDQWYPDLIDWKKYSLILPKFFGEFFLIWWDPVKFDWTKLSCEELVIHCNKFFPVWWDSDKFKSSAAGEQKLIRYCKDYFYLFWNKRRTSLFFSSCLAEYCLEYTPIWWSGYQYFDWQLGARHLVAKPSVLSTLLLYECARRAEKRPLLFSGFPGFDELVAYQLLFKYQGYYAYLFLDRYLARFPRIASVDCKKVICKFIRY